MLWLLFFVVLLFSLVFSLPLPLPFLFRLLFVRRCRSYGVVFIVGPFVDVFLLQGSFKLVLISLACFVSPSALLLGSFWFLGGPSRAPVLDNSDDLVCLGGILVAPFVYREALNGSFWRP